MRLLLVGWNPPCPGGGFWSRDDDRLLRSLHTIFLDLEWATADSPTAFRDEFLKLGFHVIHAVKCFSAPRRPSAALVRTCALAHLRADVEHLRPERICLLGQVPFRAVKTCYAEHLRGSFARQETTLPICGAAVPVLVTYFPNDRRRQGAAQRTVARDDLRTWARTLTVGAQAKADTGRLRLSFDTACRVTTLGQALARLPFVRFAYLFGSAARGELRVLSDIDVAVWLDEAHDAVDARLAVIDIAARHLGTDAVDVVVLNSAPTALLGRVLADRSIILDRDPFLRHRFESAELRKSHDFALREQRLLTARYPGGRRDAHPA